MKINSATGSAGWWGGVLSQTAYKIFPKLRPKCRLRVIALCGVKLQMPPVWQFFGVRVTNVGREPVVVSGIAVRCRGAGEDCLLAARNVPKRLEPNESVDELFEHANGLPTDAEALYAYDSSGGEWRLPQNQLKQLLQSQMKAAVVDRNTTTAV